MYVRTKEGKIFNCFASESMGKPVYYIKDSLTNGFIDYNEAYKVSPNIIDIVQVGDYVNGELVVAIHKNYVCDEIKLGIALETACNYTAILNEDIKSIVTKEMFYSMEYRLGDDK